MKTLLVTFGAATLLTALVCVSVGTAGPKVHWASGGGTVEYSGALNTHAFTAQIDADGNVKGQAVFQLRYIDATIHAELNCLAVVGNDAWIGGTITHSSNPAVVGPGLDILFQVRDGGEGDAGPPDMTSPLVWGAVPSCNTPPPLSLIEWTHGNVQVDSLDDQPVARPTPRHPRPNAVDYVRVEPTGATPTWGGIKARYRWPGALKRSLDE
jgi:hypothetical protein